eukprot:UN16676
MYWTYGFFFPGTDSEIATYFGKLSKQEIEGLRGIEMWPACKSFNRIIKILIFGEEPVAKGNFKKESCS